MAQPGPDIPGLAAVLAADPFDAPESDALAALGLDRAQLAHAVRAGLLLRLTDGVYVGPNAPRRAVEVLAGLHGAFTVSARAGWRTEPVCSSNTPA